MTNSVPMRLATVRKNRVTVLIARTGSDGSVFRSRLRFESAITDTREQRPEAQAGCFSRGAATDG